MPEALSVAFAPTPLGADEYLVVRATAMMSPGRNFAPRSAYRDIFVGAAATASPANVLAGYQAVFGTPLVAGEKIFMEAFTVNEFGFASIPAKASVIVA